MPGKQARPGQARVLSVLRNSKAILGALQPASEHSHRLLNFQSAYSLSTRPHLNIKCLTEPGDQCTQPAVSQLPASRLRNASFVFPKSCRGVCQQLPGPTSTEEEMLLCRAPPPRPNPQPEVLWAQLYPFRRAAMCGPLSHKGPARAPNLRNSLRTGKEA